MQQTAEHPNTPAQLIEEICCGLSHSSLPPEAFLISSDNVAHRLLCVSVSFLEDGQQVPCPGLPLAGGVFGPDWGFSSAEIGKRADGTEEFRLPAFHFGVLASGDVYGYRFCIIDNEEVSEAKRQLDQIRLRLTTLRWRMNPFADLRVHIAML